MRSSLAQIFAIVPGQQLAYGFTSGIYGCQRTGNTDEVREKNTHKAEWTLVWPSREGEGREKGQGLRPGVALFCEGNARCGIREMQAVPCTSTWKNI